MPLTISPQELLKSGVHFGHKVCRWNPKMKPYIFGKRNLIHIIDVKETIKGLVKACHFLEQLAARGHLILFVGTKRQAGAVLKEEATKAGMPYVSERWLGGMLTNFDTIRKRLGRLKEIEAWEKDGTLSRYSKKEQSSILRQKRKLLRNLDGIRNMDRLPACLVIVDPKAEAIAVAEAAKIGAATVALIDSDGDPDAIDIPIPGNDDSMKVITIVMAKLGEAIAEGKSKSIGVAVPVEEGKGSPKAVPTGNKVGAISVGKGGRPRRTTIGRGTETRPRPAHPAPIAPSPAPAPVTPPTPSPTTEQPKGE
jgi:small subunit ribosomal protein S2